MLSAYEHDCTGRWYQRNDMQHVINMSHESWSKSYTYTASSANHNNRHCSNSIHL